MQGYAFQASVSRISMTHRRADIDKANQLTAIVRGPEGSPQFYLAIISITVQLGTLVFWVISVWFNIRNTLPKFGPFLLWHPVYIYILLRYWSDGSGIDSRWCHWIFQWHISFRPYHGPGVDTVPIETKYQEYFLGVKPAGAWSWQPHHLNVPNVMKSGSLNLLEPSGPHRAGYGIALPHLFCGVCGVLFNVCHTWKYYSMCASPGSIIQCMLHLEILFNVCLTWKYYSMYASPGSIIRCMPHLEVLFDVCLTTATGIGLRLFETEYFTFSGRHLWC